MKTGQDLLALWRTRIGEAYEFVVVPKNDRNWHGPWDCAEGLSWTVYQVAQILYGCNSDVTDPAKADAGTIYWARDARTKGRIISVDQAAAIPGAAVLRLAADGQYGHIVMSDGKGGTVEAHSHADGVIASTLHGRRWSLGILVPGIEYQPVPLLPVRTPAATIYYLASPLMWGEVVFKIQCALNHLGYLEEGRTDWVYGPETAAAVKAFQKAQGLVADGETGPLTLAALGVKL
ncbi:MAG: peptidoglycan-binding domain-containing protein [Deltaproteobacteria bacterium]|nr:peptidoglycan-binding domain-containing protein [Deltaproteobacteria bacterium]